jgi:hypothetical protein
VKEGEYMNDFSKIEKLSMLCLSNEDLSGKSVQEIVKRYQNIEKEVTKLLEEQPSEAQPDWGH